VSGKAQTRSWAERSRREAFTVLFFCLASVALLNRSVSYFGDTQVFLFSPYFLGNKVRALGTYLLHRTVCSITGHPPIEPLIASAERKYNLPTGLLKALIEVESGAKPHRISPAGAMGAGQLIPSTAGMLSVRDPFNSETAVDGSARYLAQQLRTFRNVRLAVAAYNAGPHRIHGRVPNIPETRLYVTRVMARYAKHKPRLAARK